MNFLAHLVLAGDDESLRMGAMLGDFVRGKDQLDRYSEDIRLGILLHRHIDGYIDALPDIINLRRKFRNPFRRYSGIVIDLAFDHELAKRWSGYSDITLEQFDIGVREMLMRNEALVPERLKRFMIYADSRGLFAAYRSKDEILHSLVGIGRRLSRPNPLDRVGEIWDDLQPRFETSFGFVFRQVQIEVARWLQTHSRIEAF